MRSQLPRGVVILPEGLQIGRGTTVPWSGVDTLRVTRDRVLLRRREQVVLALKTPAMKAAGVRRQRHGIDVKARNSTADWIVAATLENATEAGVHFPNVALDRAKDEGR